MQIEILLREKAIYGGGYGERPKAQWSQSPEDLDMCTVGTSVHALLHVHFGGQELPLWFLLHAHFDLNVHPHQFKEISL